MTHHDKKLQGGPNPSVGSGDQLDQSQDSEDKKESGYNLRNMFKDDRSALDTSNGIAPNVGKRRKSGTIFGLRRGSDPAVSKSMEGTGKEAGGGMFAVQKRSAVPEELSKTDSFVDPLERSTKPNTPDQKAETANTLPEIKNQFQGGSDQFSSPVPCINQANKGSLGGTADSAPSCLLIPSPMSSAQVLLPEKHGDVENFGSPNKNVDDPGPLQSSTPSAPMQRTISGHTAVVSANPSEYHPSSSTAMESSNSLALIGLGSSPPSASRIKSVSSSLSNTPTVTPKPEISSATTPSEAARNTSTVLKAQSQSFSSSKEQELEGVGLPKTQEKTETHGTGMMTMPKFSLVGGDLEATSPSSPPYHLNRDRPFPPSSPVENTNITIIKSRGDRKREFSVVTHVEEDSSTSTKDRISDTSEPGVGSEELQTVSDVGQAESQDGESSEAQDNRSTVNKRGDSVESKDIA